MLLCNHVSSGVTDLVYRNIKCQLLPTYYMVAWVWPHTWHISLVDTHFGTISVNGKHWSFFCPLFSENVFVEAAALPSSLWAGYTGLTAVRMLKVLLIKTQRDMFWVVFTVVLALIYTSWNSEKIWCTVSKKLDNDIITIMSFVSQL